MQNPFEIPLMKIGRVIVALKPVIIDDIGVEALKFIDDNFAMQGYQGRTFIPWKIQLKPNKPRPHKILILDVILRGSFVKTDGAQGTVISTDIPYARAHNEGDKGQHYATSRMGTFGKTFTVNRNMPQRQFMPITGNDSPVLTARCEEVIIRRITDAIAAT